MKQKAKEIVFCTLLCVTLAACSQQESPGQPEEQQKTPAVQPVEEEPVRLSLARERCSAADKQVEYTIANTTGQRLGVHPVPRLERNTDTGWQTVPCHGGFCGVEDPLGEQWEGVLDLEWFAPLEPGEYRLTMTVTRQGEEWMQVQDTFRLEA